MPGSVLLDTSVVIPFRAKDPDVLGEMAAAESVYVPIVVIGELLFGALKSPRPEENCQWIETFLSRVALLDCDVDTARMYAEIRNTLRIAGSPIPENDLWIAAVAVQHGLILAARDKHFAGVPGLVTATW